MAAQEKRRKRMIKKTLTKHDDVIVFICVGELMEDDLERMHRLIHGRLAVNSNPGFLLDLT